MNTRFANADDERLAVIDRAIAHLKEARDDIEFATLSDRSVEVVSAARLVLAAAGEG